MATERVEIVIESRGARKVQRDLKKVSASAKAASKTLALFRNTLVALAAFRVIGKFIELADAFTNMQNRIRAVVPAFESVISRQQELIDVSIATRSSLEGTVEIFSRLALGARDVGINNNRLVNITKTLNQATLLYGATAQEARNALIQFSQGIASGTIRGDELRSVLEQLPIVARLIAKELGVTQRRT
jgi:tape measure domain-containing protein